MQPKEKKYEYMIESAKTGQLENLSFYRIETREETGDGGYKDYRAVLGQR